MPLEQDGLRQIIIYKSPANNPPHVLSKWVSLGLAARSAHLGGYAAGLFYCLPGYSYFVKGLSNRITQAKLIK